MTLISAYPAASYSLRVSMERIEKEGYNLNISRYISTAQAEAEVDLMTTHAELETRLSESTPRETGTMIF